MLSFIKKIKEKKLRDNVYFLYTLLFVVVLLGCFIYYFKDGRSFIWYYDGIGIYIKKIIWYRRYIINFFKNLFIEHKFILPIFEFNFGEGTDVIQAFSGNAIGDPFLLFSVFFPEKLIGVYYSLSVVIRLYLAGIAFIILCKTLKKQNNIAIVAGALTYAFCMWSIQNSNRHVIFLNFNVFFPLLIVGFENILKQKRPYLYIAMIFIMFSSSTYFSYQIVFFMVIYVVVRLITLKYNLKKFIITILTVFAYSIIGVGLSAIIFFPAVHNLLNETRMSQNFANYMFYESNYYRTLLKNFISYGQSHLTIMGYSSLTLLAMILLFLKNKYKIHLKIFFLIGILMISLPFFGKLMNGMGYITNRWIWVFALLTSYILTDMWSYFRLIEKKDFVRIFNIVVVYTIISELASKSINANFLVQVILIVDAILLLFFFSKNYQIEYLLLVITAASIIINSYYLNSPKSGNYVSEAVKYEDINKMVFDTPSSQIKNIFSDDKSYYKYSAKKLINIEDEYITGTNDSIVSEIPTIEYNSSLTNNYIDRFNKNLSLVRSYSHIWEDLDQKTILNTLSNVKYVATYDKSFIPYGYDFVLENEGYYYYKNKYNLPLVYNYKKYMPENEFNEYNPIEKQELMIDTAAIQKYDGNFALKNENYIASCSEIDYTIIATNSNAVAINSKSFITYGDNTEILINVDSVPKTETHLLIDGLYIRQIRDYDLFYNKNISYRGRIQKIDRNNIFDQSYLTKSQDHFIKEYRNSGGESSLIIKVFVGEKEINFKYLTSYNSDFGNFHNFDINLGYFEDAIENVRIVLPKMGIYSFEKFKMISLPFEHYDNHIMDLKDDEVSNIEVKNDIVSFDVNSKENKFLCCAIPYSKGWTAYVDGRKTSIYLTNIRYMGIDVPRGDHKVEFRYTNSMFRIGAFISLISLLFVIYYVFQCEKCKEGIDFSLKKAVNNLYVSIDNNISKNNIYKTYTIVFIITLFACFHYQLLNNGTFVWRTDGMGIYIKKIIWFSRTIKEFLYNLFVNHKFIVPMWEFNFGEGADIVQAFSSNAIGDPFVLFSVFFPERYMAAYYTIFQIIRLYLAGVAFIYLCRNFSKVNKIAIITGAITYVFCGWNIINVQRHHMFLNFNIYFPLLLVGIERIIKKHYSYLYVVVIFLMFSNSLYLSYQIVIFTVTYVLLRIILMKLNIVNAFKLIFIIFVHSIIGVVIASYLVFPCFANLINDMRVGGNGDLPILYPQIYYERLLSLFLTSHSYHQYTALGFSVVALFSYIYLFVDKNGNKLLKFMIVLGAIFYIFPFFGKLFNGGGYVTNRWCWVYALVVSFTVVNCLEKVEQIKKQELYKVIFIILIYSLICCGLNYSYSKNFEYQIYLLVLFVMVYIYAINKKVFIKCIEFFALILTIISFALNSYFMYSPRKVQSTNIPLNYNEFQNRVFESDVKEIKDISNNTTDYFRYFADRDENDVKSWQWITDFNLGLIEKMSSIEYYTSLTNPYIQRFNKNLFMLRAETFRWTQYDNKSLLYPLLNVKYYMNNNNSYPPYGYELTKETNKGKIYSNKFALPLMYSYNQYIDEDNFSLFDPVAKQELMSMNAVIKDYDGKVLHKAMNNNLKREFLDYKVSLDRELYSTENHNIVDIQDNEMEDNEIEDNEIQLNEIINEQTDIDNNIIDSVINQNISLIDNTYKKLLYIDKNYIIAQREGISFDLVINGKQNAETHIVIEGFDFEEITEYDMYFNKLYDFNGTIYNIDPYNNFKPYFIKNKHLNTMKMIDKYNQTGRDDINILFEANNKNTEMLKFHKKDSPFYGGYHSFDICLGYNKEPTKSITVTLPLKGIYKFSNIKIIDLPLDDYENNFSRLKDSEIKNVNINTNKIIADLHSNNDKFICCSMPYSKNWKAYIDGKETKIYIVNLRHMGIDVPKGKHHIEFKYKNYFLIYGCIVSIVSMVLFMFMMMFFKLNKNKLKYKE